MPNRLSFSSFPNTSLMSLSALSFITGMVFFFLLCFAIASCTYTQKIQDGRTAFERKQYAVAIPMLQKEFKKADTRLQKSKLAYQLAESYDWTNQTEQAAEWYKTAYDNQYGSEALKGYAYVLKKNERYKEAATSFKELGAEIGSPYEYKKEITACTQAIAWKNAPNRSGFEVALLEGINSPNADYAPAWTKTNALLITSDRNAATGDKKYKWFNRKFSDIFSADIENRTVQILDNQINTDMNEGAAFISKDGTELYFTRAMSDNNYEDAFTKILVSTLEDGQWSAPSILPFCQEKMNYGQPTLSADGTTLYFSCNASEGWGGHDLYSTTRLKEGWSEPQLLPRNINSDNDELFPFIEEDTLYFASNGWVGMGGLDIFKCYKTGKNTWSQPQNLKAPINSGADDFSFIIDHKTTQNKNKSVFVGYFASNRKGGMGGDDIYSIQRIAIPPLPPSKDSVPNTTTATPSTPIYKLRLDGYVLEKIYAQANNPNSKVIGRKPLLGSTINASFGKETKTIATDADGHFQLDLIENLDYFFYASKTDYLNNSAKFSTKGIGKDPKNPVQTFEVEIVLDKIYKNQEIVLDNIYYDYNQWDIRSDARPTLDRLASTLAQNPTLNIQLSSHTDCRGNEVYNESLSQKRAQSAVDYLILKGIEATRLTAKGYGESSPAVSCDCTQCTEREHQANRRTTFKVVE